MITFIALWALYGFAVLRLGPRWNSVRYLPFVIGSLIVTAPFWSLAIVMLVPSSCKLNEGGPHPCSLFGADFGELLYVIGNMAAWGWFFLPILAIAGAVYVALHLPFFLVAVRRDKAANPPQPRPRQVAVAGIIVMAILLLQAWYDAATSKSVEEQREYNSNWRSIVGIIPAGCPASVTRANSFVLEHSGLMLTPEKALSAAVASGKVECKTTSEQTIYNNAANFYIRTPGSPLEVVVDGGSGNVSVQKLSGRIVGQKE